MNATPPNGVTTPSPRRAERERIEASREQHDAGDEQPRRASAGPRAAGTVQHQHADAEQPERMPRVIVDRGLPDADRVGRERAPSVHARRMRPSATATAISIAAPDERESGGHFRLHWRVAERPSFQDSTMTIERRNVGKRLSDLVIYAPPPAGASSISPARSPRTATPTSAAQTRSVLAQIDRLLGEAGTDKTHILSATIYLADMGDYAGDERGVGRVGAAGRDARARDRRGAARQSGVPRRDPGRRARPAEHRDATMPRLSAAQARRRRDVAARRRDRHERRRDAARDARDVRRGDGAVLRARAVHPGARRRLARVGPGRAGCTSTSRAASRSPSLGHCHPAMVKRARRRRRARCGTCRTGSPTSPRCGSRSGSTDATFAERVFFCNSGAEANEAALKLARRYAHDRSGPQKMPRRLDARTRSTAARCSRSPPADRRNTRRLRTQSRRHHAHAATTTSRRSKREFAAHGNEICAVILEPMQGEGGMTPGTPEYLQAARRLCTAHGALLILDEIQSGMGRTGALFSYMQKGIVPDILTSAKGLGGGFPIGAMLTTDRRRERVLGRRARHDVWRQSARVRGRGRGVRRHQHDRGARRRQGAARAVHGRPAGDQRAPPRVRATCAAKACGSAASSTRRGAASRWTCDAPPARRDCCCSSRDPTSCASRRRS